MYNTIIDKIDLWTAAQELKTSNRGRSASNQSLLGIKKLRELILELAVRGKLVPQDPNDEPASELLKKIEAEKRRFIKEGKIKKQEVLPEVGEDEKPFELPNGWSCIRFGNISVIERGGSPRPIESYLTTDSEGLNWIKIGDTEIGGKYITSTKEKIIKEGLTKTRMVYSGDFLLTNSMSFGRPYITLIDGCIHDGWLRIHPPKNLNKDYLYYLLSSPYVSNFFRTAAAGAVVMNLNSDKVRELPIVLPPIHEQQRIAIKVDELMSLCDELENQQTNSNVAHETLVATLLGSLTDAENSDSFDESWQRIASHFDILFTTEHSIDQLKQTILQLAVMGKLVPQNPEDEPAAELLKKIAKEKARLVNEGKIKKQAPLPEITEDEKPFKLPEGWDWVRLGTYGIVFSGNSFKSEDFNEDSGTKVIKITNAGVGDFVETNDFLPSSFLNEYEQYVVKEDDLILALTRPYISTGLKISKCPKSYNNSLLNQRVAAIRVNTGLDYVFLFLQSSFVLNLYMERFGNSGLQPNLKVSDVTELILPIPPLAEQQRIAYKVGELFALCDGLKERLVEAQTLQNHMAVAVVEKALSTQAN